MSSFLGSGAFGEVYEGCVTNMGTERETRVAIKTLRKGATDQEKAEFLQEAQLMSNFKHKHILRMIGVCLDFDSLYIVMELMQGGDLLSFLRQSRPLDVIVNYTYLLSQVTHRLLEKSRKMFFQCFFLPSRDIRQCLHFMIWCQYVLTSLRVAGI